MAASLHSRWMAGRSRGREQGTVGCARATRRSTSSRSRRGRASRGRAQRADRRRRRRPLRRDERIGGLHRSGRRGRPPRGSRRGDHPASNRPCAGQRPRRGHSHPRRQRPVQLEIDGGDADVSWVSLGGAKDSLLVNKSGNVTVRIPAGASCRVEAKSRYGRVDSSLPTVKVLDDQKRPRACQQRLPAGRPA